MGLKTPSRVRIPPSPPFIKGTNDTSPSNTLEFPQGRDLNPTRGFETCAAGSMREAHPQGKPRQRRSPSLPLAGRQARPGRLKCRIRQQLAANKFTERWQSGRPERSEDDAKQPVAKRRASTAGAKSMRRSRKPLTGEHPFEGSTRAQRGRCEATRSEAEGKPPKAAQSIPPSRGPPGPPESIKMQDPPAIGGKQVYGEVAEWSNAAVSKTVNG